MNSHAIAALRRAGRTVIWGPLLDGPMPHYRRAAEPRLTPTG